MKNKIINDDCIKVMENMDSNSVDHVITDIPYDVVSPDDSPPYNKLLKARVLFA